MFALKRAKIKEKEAGDDQFEKMATTYFIDHFFLKIFICCRKHSSLFVCKHGRTLAHLFHTK